MSNTEIIPGREKKEKAVVLSSLKPNNVFRLPGNTFEQDIEADDGPNFYYVLGGTKNKLIRVVQVDFALQRRLPEETKVIQHRAKLAIFPNE